MNWSEAIAALEKSTALAGGGDANDWLFLAMAHWQLGTAQNAPSAMPVSASVLAPSSHRTQAHDWYQKVVEWMDKNNPHDELRRFRTEAEELMGLNEPSPGRGGGQ